MREHCHVLPACGCYRSIAATSALEVHLIQTNDPAVLLPACEQMDAEPTFVKMRAWSDRSVENQPMRHGFAMTQRAPRRMLQPRR